MPLEIHATCGSVLMRNIFSAASVLTKYGNINFDTDRVHLNVSSGSIATTMWATIDKKNFRLYELPFGNRIVGMKLAVLAQVLEKGCAPNRELSIIKNDDKNFVQFVFTENDVTVEEQRIYIVHPYIARYDLDFQPGSFFRLSSAKFGKAIRSLWGDQLKIAMNIDSERVVLRSIGDVDIRTCIIFDGSNDNNEVDDDDSGVIEVCVNQAVRAIVPIRFLLDVVKATPISDMVTVQFQHKGQPLVITYKIDSVDGANSDSYIRYSVCQRVPGFGDAQERSYNGGR